MENETKYRFLMVEDLPSDMELAVRSLKKNGLVFEYLRVETEKTFLDAIANFKPHLIISDYSMPQFNGMRALELAKQQCPKLPFIVLIGSINEETAVSCMKAGATDYILKEKITRLPYAVKEALKNAENLQEKERIEKELLESEERYRTLFENNHAIMLLIDPEDGAIIDANPAACKFYGYSFDQMVNKTIADFNRMSNDELQLRYKSAMQGSGFFMQKHYDAQGKQHYVDVYTGPARIEGKTYLYSIIHNVSERVKAEQQVKLLSSAIEQSPTAIIITDAEGNVEFVNNKFITQMQYTLDEVRGNKPHIFDPEHAPEKQFKAMWNTINSGKVWEGDNLNYKKDNTSFWEHVIISPMHDDKGVITNFIIIKEDITEKKHMLEDLISAKDKAEESDRLKTAFLHNISHEIRTPMNAIIGFSSLIAEPEIPQSKSLVYSGVIVENCNQLLNIVEDIIDVATIEAGQVKAHKDSVDLNNLMTEMYDGFLKLAKERNNQLTIENTIDDKKAKIIIDEVKLKGILSNIIDNALKFTTGGSVKFGYRLGDNEVEFFVNDNGIGIPKDKQQVIF